MSVRLSKEISEALARIGNDPAIAVQTFFRIKNKQGQLVNFRYNRAQQAIRRMREEGSNFIKVLKYRKGGVSSQRIAEDLWKCATRKREHRILLTQTGDDADIMLKERVVPFLNECKVPLGGVSRDGMIVFPATDSRYYVGTAGSKKFGRGADITGRHFSEKAHWDNPDVVTGIEEGMIDFADGLTETTANGHNFFKIEWDASQRGEGSEKALFLGWWMNEEYVADATAIGPMGEEERKLLDAFNVTPAQLAWRREKLRTMQQPELFPQEYPAFPEEAFLSSGRPVFDWISLLHHQSICADEKFKGFVRDFGPNGLKFTPDVNGQLKIWKMPEHGHRYAIGGDVAEGVKGGAYSAAFVLDLGDSEQVAEWHGHIAPDLFGEVLFDLGMFYNHAVVIPESWPGPGGVTCAYLTGKGYPNVWQGPDISRPGWETNRRSKPDMILALAGALRDLMVTIRSKALLSELRSYIYTEKNEMEPSLGNFSDRVIAAAIAWFTTREIARSVDYYASRRQTPLSDGGSGVASAPRWRGQMPGRHGD